EHLQTISTPVGLLHVPGISDEQSRGHFSSQCLVFCQGLPMSCSSYDYDHRVIVHLDHRKFKPRMPDRDGLIDSKEAKEAIAIAVKEVWRVHLEAQKSAMPPQAFIDRYWKAAYSAGLEELMNDVPILPACELRIIDDTPTNEEDCSFYGINKTPVTQAQVESGEMVLCEDIEHEDSVDGFAKLMFAKALGYLFTSHRLHEDHWAQPFIKDLDQEKVRISGKVIARDHFSGGFVSADVRVFETLSVTIAGQRVILDEPVSLGSHYSYRPSILVPKGSTYASGVLLQLSTYRGENDTFQQTDLDLDREALENLLAILNGEEGVETLTKSLQSSGAQNKANLRNRSFLVKFDEKGRLSVEAA
ncbi:MAG TPA: hypothetical protein DCQ20_00075, partial [Nitrospira sp.]|nr:hypothetical protein [Nitrospira sp.]